MTDAVLLIQVFFGIIIGLYFFNLYRNQQGQKMSMERESKKQMDKLNRMRSITLTEPLSEKTRPAALNDIIGQEEGIRALKAALCSKNPQHVLIYGPPGVGKTCAARLMLEEAKKTPHTPFLTDAKFVEMDATCIRFDERSIADPLIGSVHDPIYQGAGAFGPAGIPQPKPGAVTKAHGGVLFLDEIGEIHPIQMNKLLKVLEDRKVFFESAYYNSEDKHTPKHIHDIFKNGLPADFRLIGATTKQPHDIPPAIRSRCMEIYFRPLYEDETEKIAYNAAKKGGMAIDGEAANMAGEYAANGRDAVNIVQLACGVVFSEARQVITRDDIEWVVNTGRYIKRPNTKVRAIPKIGLINGLAVYGANMGTTIEIEAAAVKHVCGKGSVMVTGFVEEEELAGPGRKTKRKSTAKGAIENVMTVLKKHFNMDIGAYDIHVNLAGGIPVDGPSAGIAVACAVYSAVTNRLPKPGVAMTGELSISGEVRPVGAVRIKLEAARRAGVRQVLIPKDNYSGALQTAGVPVIPVSEVSEAIAIVFGQQKTVMPCTERNGIDMLSAESLVHTV